MNITFATSIILVITWCSLHTVNGAAFDLLEEDSPIPDLQEGNTTTPDPDIDPNECTDEESQCGKPGNNGVCRSQGCRSGERVSSYNESDCPGEDCQCCEPEKQNKPNECIVEKSQCGKLGNFGVCRTQGCQSGEKVSNDSKSDCPGEDCQCCKPQEKPSECPEEEDQCGRPENYGVCRTLGCLAGERASNYSESDCAGKDCQCCETQKQNDIPPAEREFRESLRERKKEDP